MASEFKAKYQALSDALEMVDDAIEVARKALLGNPDREERLRLNELILELEAKRAKIVNKMAALGRKTGQIAMPSKSRIEKMKALATQVDDLTRSAQGAGKAIEVAGKVLEMAGKSGFA